MSTDLEDRLRAMYTAVADATLVDDDAGVDGADELHAVDVVRHEDRAIGSRRLVLATALVVAVLAATVLLWGATRRSSEPAGPMDGRSIAVPMHLPERYGYREGTVSEGVPLGPAPAFAPVAPDSTVAVVVFRGPRNRELTVSSTDDPTVRPTAGSSTVTLGSGATATVTTFGGSRIDLSWREVDGPAVLVQADGVSQDELVDVANGMWYATRVEFDRLTSEAGFRMAGGPAWDIPGAGHLRAKVSGSLQQGLGVSVDVGDEPGGYSFVRVNPLCAAQYIAGAPGGTLEVLLFGPAGTTSFTVRLPDGTQLGPVPAGTPLGLPNTRLGDAELAVGLDTMNRVSVRCDGVTP